MMDKHEKSIHDAFSAVKVDAVGFEEKLDFNKITKTKKVFKLPKMVAAGLIFVMLSVGTAYAAGGGAWEFLQNIFSSPFAGLTVDQGGLAYAEDQGVRIEIIGAEEIDDTIVLVIAVQDVNDKFDFSSGVVPFPHFDDIWNTIMWPVDFNAETNTHYFHANMVMKQDVSSLNILALSISNISFGTYENSNRVRHIYGNWHFDVRLSDFIHSTITLENIEITFDDLDVNINEIRITPIAIRMTWERRDLARLYLEMGDSIISIENAMGSDYGTDYLTSVHHPETPIDVENVTAIIINDVRIPIE